MFPILEGVSIQSGGISRIFFRTFRENVRAEFTADGQLIHHLAVFLFISVKIEEKCPREPQIDRSVNQTLMIED